MFDAYLQGITAAAARANPRKPEDYVSDDGILFCGVCHTPKQCRIQVFGKVETVYCLCQCGKELQESERQQRQLDEIEQRRKTCFPDAKFRTATFAEDDGKNAELSRLCKRYTETFTRESKWLLLYGDCGTGKSFMAACIANALLDKGMTARFTTVSEVERLLWNNPDKNAVFDDLSSIDLLILDDFGSERKSEFVDEIKFSVIDGRLRAGKPCVITTNLTLADFSAPADTAQRRLASRLFEVSIPYEVRGEDRRFSRLKETGRAALDALLKG